MGPKDTVFVFIDDILDPEQNARFNELRELGYCNLDRDPTKPTAVTFLKGGVPPLDIDLSIFQTGESP